MVGVDSQAWNVIEEPPLEGISSLLPMEGTFRLLSSENYEAFLACVGVKPLMASMVMRSDEMITLFRDVDRRWKIMSEKSIKAKSLRGFLSRNFKLVSNKFVSGEPKPECLDDWDQRMVVSTLTLEEDGNKLVITQIAEKDLQYSTDAVITYTGNGDILTMSIETSCGISASKKYVRHQHQPQEDLKPKRKVSLPF
ncbi:unnamed protein product [Lepeophtheirus salmonis]|uniref:(salmon louse) hypothetical protein n=1 Tax=Lepeophtheirus salmonis TaxID=72036 RepID=A0A0K2UAC3_LEPSM|nr:uncharacterized protein LOC121129754 [Lepeophtheirus salmonis]CAB4059100.1 unnamed protein product [Lepeophtheirus salmonis]CAF2844133.1 unnamed protein product [Lepeophtheirus salmonis]